MDNNTALSGAIPVELERLAPSQSGSLLEMTISGTSVTGVIPEEICHLNYTEFDCSEFLCGFECECLVLMDVENNTESSALSSSSEVDTQVAQTKINSTANQASATATKTTSMYRGHTFHL